MRAPKKSPSTTLSRTETSAPGTTSDPSSKVEPGQAVGTAARPVPSPVSPLEQGLQLREPPMFAIPDVEQDEPDKELRAAIWKQIGQLGLAQQLAPEEPSGGLDLSSREQRELEKLDHTRLARLVYGLSYVRLLELLARGNANFTQMLEVAKVAMAYVRHVETNDRDTLRLDARNVSDQHLDASIEKMSTEILRVATTYRRQAT